MKTKLLQIAALLVVCAGVTATAATLRQYYILGVNESLYYNRVTDFVTSYNWTNTHQGLVRIQELSFVFGTDVVHGASARIVGNTYTNALIDTTTNSFISFRYEAADQEGGVYLVPDDVLQIAATNTFTGQVNWAHTQLK